MEDTKLKNDEKLDFKRVLPIFLIVLIDLLGLTIMIPLLPLYAVSFGADAFTIGLVGAAYPVMQLVGSPLLGGLSDRFGRKPVLVVSQIGTLAGFILLGFANTLPLIFLARLIDGLTGGNIVVAQAAITDSTTSQTRAQGLGLLGAAFGLGFTLGPAIAGIALAASGQNFQVPAFIAAGFSLVSIVLTIFWFQETLPEHERGKAKNDVIQPNILSRILIAIRNPLVGALLMLMFLQQVVFGGFEQLFAVFTLTRLGMDGAANALMFVVVGIIIVAVQGGLIGKWSRQYGERKLIYAGLGLLAVGLILFALTPPVPVPWYSRTTLVEELTRTPTTLAENNTSQDLGVALPDESGKGWLGFVWMFMSIVPASLGGALLSPSINSLITKRSTAGNIGGALGVSSALVSAANALTPATGGILFQVFGASAPFLSGGVIMGVLLIVAMRLITPQPQDTALTSLPGAVH